MLSASGFLTHFASYLSQGIMVLPQRIYLHLLLFACCCLLLLADAQRTDPSEGH